MTRIFSTLLIMLVATVVITSCQPDKMKDYEPVTTGGVESIAGTWTGTTVLQRDMDAQRKNYPYKTQDISSTLEFNKVKITLVANAGQPTTFNIDHGTAPPIFRITSGTWKVDNAQKVGNISLINGADTIKLVLGSYNLLASNKMMLKQSKTLLGVEVINYEFNFSK